MSYVTVVPEMLTAAATDVAAVGSTVNAAHLAAAAPTVALLPAAADEVSASVTHLFSQAAQDFHALAGQAAAFNQQFVQHLTASAHSYAATEAASAASLPSAALDLSSIAVLPGQVLDGLIGSLDGIAAYGQFWLGVLYLLADVPLIAAYLVGISAFVTLVVGAIALQLLRLLILLSGLGI
jgi:hypothetical protein